MFYGNITMRPHSFFCHEESLFLNIVCIGTGMLKIDDHLVGQKCFPKWQHVFCNNIFIVIYHRTHTSIFNTADEMISTDHPRRKTSGVTPPDRCAFDLNLTLEVTDTHNWHERQYAMRALLLFSFDGWQVVRRVSRHGGQTISDIAQRCIPKRRDGHPGSATRMTRTRVRTRYVVYRRYMVYWVCASP